MCIVSLSISAADGGGYPLAIAANHLEWDRLTLVISFIMGIFFIFAFFIKQLSGQKEKGILSDTYRSDDMRLDDND